MHFAAESGAAKHAAYKGHTHTFPRIPARRTRSPSSSPPANAAAEQRFGAFRGFGDSARRRVTNRRESLFESLRRRESLRPRVPDVRPGRRRARHPGRAAVGHRRGVARSGDRNRRFRASARYASPFTSADDEGVAADELLEMLDADEDGTVSAEEFARFAASLRAIGSLPGADAATAAAIEGSIASTSRYSSKSRDARRDDDDQNDENVFTTTGRSEAGANDKNVNDVSADVDGELVVSENFARDDDEHSDDTRVRDDEKHKKHKKHLIEDAISALADASAMAAPPLPPAPPPPRVRGGDAAARDAGKALREKAGGVVEWQLVWDLTRAGRPRRRASSSTSARPRHQTSRVYGSSGARFELKGETRSARADSTVPRCCTPRAPRARAPRA